jgi:hypothetical protein
MAKRYLDVYARLLGSAAYEDELQDAV